MKDEVSLEKSQLDLSSLYEAVEGEEELVASRRIIQSARLTETPEWIGCVSHFIKSIQPSERSILDGVTGKTQHLLTSDKWRSRFPPVLGHWPSIE